MYDFSSTKELKIIIISTNFKISFQNVTAFQPSLTLAFSASHYVFDGIPQKLKAAETFCEGSDTVLKHEEGSAWSGTLQRMSTRLPQAI
ncbi:hypothetical protein ACROYT_G024213 [Oculina patagonica]